MSVCTTRHGGGKLALLLLYNEENLLVPYSCTTGNFREITALKMDFHH